MSTPAWQKRLEQLSDSFHRIASRSRGVFSILVENADCGDMEEHSTALPPTVDRLLKGRSPGLRFFTLPSEPPRFRELTPAEQQAAPPPSESKDGYVRDKRGIAHAMLTRATNRMCLLHGDEDSVRQFTFLAEAAGALFRQLPSDALTALPMSVAQLATRHHISPRREIFGDAIHKAEWQSPTAPHLPWMARGWDCGVAVFERGVIVDYVQAAAGQDDPVALWVLLLHVIGFEAHGNPLVTSRRWFWDESASYEINRQNPTATIETLGKWRTEDSVVRTNRFFSVLGNGGEPGMDNCWTSKWAIDELLSATQPHAKRSLHLRKLMDPVETAVDPAAKGKALEVLLRELLPTVDGFEVLECNVHTETEEIDIVVSNKSRLSPWDREKPIVLVECKNWTQPAGKNELVVFKEKILNRRGRCSVGIMVAWSGCTAKADKELLRSSQEDWMVIQVDGATVKSAIASGGFTSMLNAAWYDALKR